MQSIPPSFGTPQTILASEKLPQVYEQSSWGAEELGPFLRLCLMDQNFPAFVEEVEKELKKITQSWETKALHMQLRNWRYLNKEY